ncbi:LacI family DNA-binding transcriptional regulator [Duganella radicis]|uniref:LacI family DNA-binding transcriptional regulator n=1 Tax=Duganella radicis TaxID=551988 RepID=A0A6L6PHB5_9BURK|nr:LacI family DNA-binding transcriptional regulator [Duganella radicis]MTV38354.1 LacI family DNA-binding transcriptional regulator [Duganella radicis]
MSKSKTIKEVAALAGVSVITASRAIRGDKYVKQETRQKVLAAAAQVEYTPNVLAQRIRGGSSRLIGVFVHGFGSSVLQDLITSINAAALELGYALLVFNSPSFDAPDRAPTSEVMRTLCDGLLIVMPNSQDALLSKLERGSTPCVLINFSARDIDLPVVVGANRAGARQAVEYLIGLGHRRVGFIGGTANTGQSPERRRGYEQALAAAGIDILARYIGQGDFTHPSGYREAKRMLAMAPPPTAIFAANDDMAFGVLDAAQEAGLVVPRDLSVIGYDDVVQASFVFPKLTTLRQPLADIATRAVAELVAIINGNEKIAMRIELPTKFIVRDSTGPAPAA